VWQAGPAASEASPLLIDADPRTSFAANGFLVVDRPIISARQIAHLRRRFDELFAGDDLPPWLHKTISDPDHPVRPVAEILTPSAGLSVLLGTGQPLRALRALASTLLDGPARLVFDHAIRRPARCPTRTPWHQDSVYFDGDDDERQRAAGERVHLWLPLVDTGPGTGGMAYVTGSHDHHRPHVSRAEHVVIDEDFPPGTIDRPSVPAGGCAAHHPMLVHGADGTAAPTARVAWITHFTLDRRPAAARRAIELRELVERRTRVLAWQARHR